MPTRVSLNWHYGQLARCKLVLCLAQSALRHQSKPVDMDATGNNLDDEAMDLDEEDTHRVDPSPQRSSPTVEEATDEGDSPQSDTWFKEFPGAGAKIGDTELPFHTAQREQHEANLDPWSPFASRQEWELAEWMMQSGISQGDMDKLLNLDLVSISCLCCRSGTILRYLTDQERRACLLSECEDASGEDRRASWCANIQVYSNHAER